MEYFLQQLINSLTLGSIYGLIAIGYTMVYGIIGMINFAHGDVFMIGSFVSLIAMVILGVGTGAFLPLALLVVLFAAILITSAYGWTLERVAYRPLRGSFRLAALITALGASIFLQNFVQVSQGAKIKPIQPVIQGGFTFFENGSLVVSLSYLQIFIIIITIILLSIFSYIISKTPWEDLKELVSKILLCLSF